MNIAPERLIMAKGSTNLASGFSRQKFAVLALLVGTVGLTYWVVQPRENLLHFALGLEGVNKSCVMDKENLLNHLYRLHGMSEANDSIENIQLQIKEIIVLLGGSIEPKNIELPTKKKVHNLASNFSSPSVLEVCPEVWLGTSGDYPFYYQGWRQVTCSNVLPFEKVITIVLYHPVMDNATCPKAAQAVLSGIRKLYPKVPVIITGIPQACVSANESLNVRVVPFDGNVSTPGLMWNKLTKLVTTPYVLIGRDLDGFIWTTNLERQVRVLSYNKSLSVAGGAVRNLTGHWRVGCFQTTMRNYILKYLEGYYASRNECMFCDYLAGPFVTRTKLVQSIQFDESLPSDILFEDWFWRIQQQSHVAVNCPDVMYLASDPVVVSKYENRTAWIPLVRKWELNRVVIPNGSVFSYSCAEAKITCKGATSRTNSFLLPICCLEQYASAFKVFNDLCRQNNVRYELDAGSILGAVKTNGMMPWDLDADNMFRTSNYSFFQSKVSYFKKLGINLSGFFKKKNHVSYFGLNTPDINVEMWGMANLSYDNATFGEPFCLFPTQVLNHGYWVYAPHSPGAFARGRYGPEILKHSHSWRHVGLKDSWQTYKPGIFNKCKKPGHHACANLFSGDGNIQFQIPN